jgi:hypothetical protein
VPSWLSATLIAAAAVVIFWWAETRLAAILTELRAVRKGMERLAVLAAGDDADDTADPPAQA